MKRRARPTVASSVFTETRLTVSTTAPDDAPGVAPLGVQDTDALERGSGRQRSIQLTSLRSTVITGEIRKRNIDTAKPSRCEGVCSHNQNTER